VSALVEPRHRLPEEYLEEALPRLAAAPDDLEEQGVERRVDHPLLRRPRVGGALVPEASLERLPEGGVVQRRGPRRRVLRLRLGHEAGRQGREREDGERDPPAVHDVSGFERLHRSASR
jgi:hypothetical protein